MANKSLVADMPNGLLTFRSSLFLYGTNNLNRVGDALTRKVALLTTLDTKFVGFDTFWELYTEDPSFGKIFAKVFVGKRNDYVTLNGYLFRGLQLCILDSSLREQIIRELHGEGHFGRDKTLALVSLDYYWPKLTSDVTRYVEWGFICKRVYQCPMAHGLTSTWISFWGYLTLKGAWILFSWWLINFQDGPFCSLLEDDGCRPNSSPIF